MVLIGNIKEFDFPHSMFGANISLDNILFTQKKLSIMKLSLLWSMIWNYFFLPNNNGKKSTYLFVKIFSPRTARKHEGHWAFLWQAARFKFRQLLFQLEKKK